MEHGTLIFMSYEMGHMHKEYLVKIHDKDNVFKKTLSGAEIKDGAFFFSRTIDSGYGPVSFDYNKKHSELDLSPFDVVYIYCNGSLIYRGFLDSYQEVWKNSTEMVRLNFIGMQSILNRIRYEYG